MFFLILGVNIFYSQENKKNRITSITEIGENLCKKTEAHLFCKAYTFFIEKKYDSCYVYCNQALLNTKKEEEKDFLNYIFSYSAFHKGFYKKSLSRLDSISKAKEYLLKKLSISGYIFLNQKKYDKATLCFEKILLLDSLKPSKDELKSTFYNLALCYLYKRQYEKAKLYFDKKLKLLNPNDTSSIINFKLSLANVYYNQYLDDKAIPLFKEAYELSTFFSDLNLKRDCAENMAYVEKDRKKYKNSIEYFIESNKWKDSIWNRDKIWELTEKDKQLAVAQKQQEIAVQQEQIKRQKVVQNGLLLGASGLLVFIGGLGYFYRKLKKQKQLITEQKEELDIANKTKNYLFSVVSHDLRSPINTIKRQHKKLAKHIANNDLSAIKEANQQAISVTDSTSHLLNNVLQWSLEQSNQLNFSQEDYALQPIIEHILFDYEELADSNEILITNNFIENITVKTDKESLKIVLRNLIDNSIKYMNGAGNIAIATSIENDLARIEIKDSGIGVSEEKLQKINELKDLSVDKIDRSKGVGLGLILCQTLIKKNNGTLFFESEEGKSTTAIVLLPLA